MESVLKVLVNVLVAALPIAAVVLAVFGAAHLLRKYEDPERRARALKGAGMGVIAAVGLFFGAFLIGESFADPGGWAAVRLTATWLVPLVAVSALAWYKPGPAMPVLWTLTVAAVALHGWAEFDSAIREMENRVGPVTMVVLIGVAVAIAFLAHTLPKQAAIMLLVAGISPVVLAAVGPVSVGPGAVGLAIFGTPMVLAAAFWLASDRIALGGPERSTGPPAAGSVKPSVA